MTKDDLKKSISMSEMVIRYGISIDRKGFCKCPFHKEKTASMKLYKDSFYCFGCGASGDIFTFVMKMEGCDFKTAFQNLGGTDEKTSKYHHQLFKYRLEKKKQQEEKDAAKRKALKNEVLNDIELQKIFKWAYPVFSDEWCEAVKKLEYDFYLLEEITKGGND